MLAKGAWDSADKLEFTVDPKRPARSSFTERPQESTAYDLSIDVEPIDELIDSLQLKRVDFIKMDIEGAEIRALAGAKGTLRRWKPLLAIAVEHTADPLSNAKAVRDLVQRLNPAYRCTAGPYGVLNHRLVPEILYFS